MSAIRFVRRNGWPLWFLLWPVWLWVSNAPSWAVVLHAIGGAGCWLIEREANHTKAEYAALKAEAAERELRDLYVEGFSTPVRVPIGMSDQEVARLLWVLSHKIEQAS